VDFDPGPGEDLRKAASCFDGFVVSLTSDGGYQWARTFGGSGRDRVGGVSVAADGAIYAAGQFEQTVDFDPGPGQLLRSSAGEIDEFLVALTPAGELAWVRTWGGPGTEYGTGHVAARSDGSLVVAGQFQQQADLDPGDGVDIRSSAGGDDVFVMVFDADGDRQWAATFGGASYDGVGRLAVGPGGAIYLTGSFHGAADFDPGPGVDLHQPSGIYAAYTTRLAPDGAHTWTRTWGAAESASGSQNMTGGFAVAAGADGQSVVAGNFQGVVDFDPGPGKDERASASPDKYDAFALRFDASGNVIEARTFGSAGLDGAYVANMHGPRVMTAGGFSGQVDFGAGLVGTATGKQDAFVVHW
jgi:hypothetical protein